MLRPPQLKLDIMIKSIKNGSPINEIFLYWVPGSGKSTVGSIVSQLIDYPDKKLLWVCPRSTLVIQAEGDFRGSGHFDVGTKNIRIASNNGDPFRGNEGAVISYQAIIANPERWVKISEQYKLILILDEFDSLTESSSWMQPIKEMYDNSFLRIPMSGTLDRSDRLEIGFIPYKNNKIYFSDTNTRKWIIYNNEQALKDGSILPFESILINGSGSYIDENSVERYFKRFSGNSNELKCAFTTEYAYSLFELGLQHWKEYRINHPWSKFLVIATNIEIANLYYKWFTNNGYRFAIATSEDSKEAKLTMKRFKKDNKYHDSYDGLISVSMIYKGMNAPACTHLIALTNIRGISYLSQAFGRIQRRFLDKTKGYLFTSDDPKMRSVLKSLKSNIINDATGEAPQKQEKSDNPRTRDYNGGITALSSEAHINDLQAPLIHQPIETQSEIETRLRADINRVVNRIVGQSSTGNKNTKSRILWLKIKMLVNDGRDEKGKLKRKEIKNMTIKELKKVKEFTDLLK